MLLDEGWAVRALVPESERPKLPTQANVEPIVGDVTRPETLRGTMDDVDGVFHLAALVESWVRRPNEFFRVNVSGTDHMIDEALHARVPRFVFTSSMSGIGVTPGQIMQEDSPPGKIFGAYEESKAAAERLVAHAVRERNLPAITLIPSIVLGPGDTRNAGRFLLSFVKGEFPGTFADHSLLPVVDVEDVARAHVLAYEKGDVGERYIISNQNLMWGELLRIASQASGTPIPSRHIGGRALRFASRIGEIRARMTGTAPRMPAWLADFMLTGAAMDNSKSIRELGMTYRPIQETIAEAIDWFREEGLFQPGPRPSVPLAGLPIENPPSDSSTISGHELAESPPPARAERRRPKPPEGPT
jgi:dihydroflavonol-4-reductase